MPFLALKYSACALVTWLLCAVYATWLNPELRFLTQLATIQKEYARGFDREQKQKVVIFGGSSCMFSIRGEQVLAESGLAIVNYGSAAGLGVKIPALQAFESLGSGDTLLIALEPAHLTMPIDLPPIAVQYSLAKARLDWILRPAFGLSYQSPFSAALAMRPGGQHMLILAAKLLRGGPLYRYNIENVNSSGWVRTPVRLPLGDSPDHGPGLVPEAEIFLKSIREACNAKRIRVAYSLPWAFSTSKNAPAYRMKNARFLLKMNRLMPVLKDEQLGAYSHAEHFADTNWHLNEIGAELRTRQLMGAIRKWSVWSSSELEELANGDKHANPGMEGLNGPDER